LADDPEAVITCSFYECGTVLWSLLQGGIEQRFQALPEFRGHIRFQAIALGAAKSVYRPVAFTLRAHVRNT